MTFINYGSQGSKESVGLGRGVIEFQVSVIREITKSNLIGDVKIDRFYTDSIGDPRLP